MPRLSFQNIEPDGARFNAPSAHSMPDRFLGVLRHERLQFGLGAFVIKKSASRAAKRRSEFRPRVGCAHIHYSEDLKPRSRRLGIYKVRRVPRLYTAPKFLFRRDKHR